MAGDIVYSLAVLMDTRNKDMTPTARHEIGSFLSLPDVTRGGILATATSYLKTYTSEQIIRSLCGSTVSLPELIGGEAAFTIYVVIPPSYVISHFNLVKAWIAHSVESIDDPGGNSRDSDNFSSRRNRAGHPSHLGKYHDDWARLWNSLLVVSAKY